MLYINLFPSFTSSVSTLSRFDSIQYLPPPSLSFSLAAFRFFLVFFLFLVLLEEYTSCTCVWFFAELSLSSQAEIHIWFATYCNACLLQRLPSLFLDIPPLADSSFSIFPSFFRFLFFSSSAEFVEEGSRDTSRDAEIDDQSATEIASSSLCGDLLPVESRILHSRVSPRTQFRSITKIRKIIAARSSPRLEARSSIRRSSCSVRVVTFVPSLRRTNDPNELR